VAIETLTYLGALQAFTPYEPEFVTLPCNDDAKFRARLSRLLVPVCLVYGRQDPCAIRSNGRASSTRILFATYMTRGFLDESSFSKQAKCRIGTPLPLLGTPRPLLCHCWRRGSESARSCLSDNPPETVAQQERFRCCN